MNEKILTTCRLLQVGPSAGTFVLDDGTSLGSRFVGYIKKVTPRYRYRLPITISTSSDDLSLWSYEPDPRADAILQVHLNQLAHRDAEAVVASRSEFHNVQLELSPDGRMILLSVPPTSGASLWAWLRGDRLGENPVSVSASKRDEAQTLYGVSFSSVYDLSWQTDLVVLAALTASTQAQKHLLNALKMLVKGQKRILRRAQESLSAKSGLSDTAIKARIDKILGRDGGGKP